MLTHGLPYASLLLMIFLHKVHLLPSPSSTKAPECGAGEFSCQGGGCVPQRWTCDAEEDCGDGSDEWTETCGKKKCGGDEWSCRGEGNTQCIPLSWVCDNRADCDDGSDEMVCTRTCLVEEFTCKNGLCIQPMWRCDGESDCGDGSDEEGCPIVECGRGEVKCGDGRCVKTRRVCDGHLDCSGGEDEEGCPERPQTFSSLNITGTCGEREWRCRDRHYCVHQAWLCDGDRDCPDGSDEEGDHCQTGCKGHQFRCNNGQCVPGTARCSGNAECNDESDEFECEDPGTGECEGRCGVEGPCLTLEQICDGNKDCPGGEDEVPERCERSGGCEIDNGGCEHKCQQDVGGTRCSCHPGYRLEDETACIEVDECMEQVGVCSQLCHNTPGSFKCTCQEGYVKDPKIPTRCKAREGHPSLLFTHKMDIRKLSLDRPAMTAIVNSTRSSCGLDFHFKTGMVFWSDVTEEAIFSAHIDEGQHRTVVASDGVVTADGLAVDWVHSHLYWTDTGTNAISVCDFTGMSRAVLVEGGLEEPRAIALHPGLGWMFWSDWGRLPRIERAGMDGSHRETIVRESVRWPNGLTIDLVLERLYWVDAKLNTVGSCSLDGSYSRTVLYSPLYLRHPFSISVFEDLMYWTEWDTHRIYQANKFTGANATTVTTTSLSQLPMVVQVYHPYRQPDFPNHCLPFNGHCSHFCLPAPRTSPASPTTSCACPSQLRMDRDKRSCLSRQQKESSDTTDTNNGLATSPAQLPGGSSQEAVPLLLLLALILLVLLALAAFYRHHWGHKLPVRWPGQGLAAKPGQTREAVRRTILTLSSSTGEAESEGLIIRGPLIDMN